ncbi:MAG: hypothetical protein ABW034_16785 [Steroidobacteraceae bacterium]
MRFVAMLFAAMSVVLSGCVVHEHKAVPVKVVAPVVKVGVDQGHCPPGQAKKGNC